MLRGLLIIAIALGAAAIATFWFACPCAVVPGGPLSGEEVATPIADWSFANTVPLCQVEVRAFVPYSVNVNCMSAGGALYVSCSKCDGKYWSSKAVTHPAGRIRVGETVHLVRFTRLEQHHDLDVAWRARATKLDLGDDIPRPDHWWSFQLTSR